MANEKGIKISEKYKKVAVGNGKKIYKTQLKDRPW